MAHLAAVVEKKLCRLPWQPPHLHTQLLKRRPGNGSPFNGPPGNGPAISGPTGNSLPGNDQLIALLVMALQLLAS